MSMEGFFVSQFTDSLRGYGFEIHRRDGFRCQYCGWDGSIWPNWLFLSVDHLLPKDHRDRENSEFKVTACFFCNVADNHYFQRADERNMSFEGRTREQLVAQRLSYVTRVRNEYQEFFDRYVWARQ
jgi:hypothetical protein